MSSIKIEFPKSNIVACVFNLRNSTTDRAEVYDEFDRCLKPADTMKKYFYRVLPHLQETLRVGDTVIVHCQTGYQICTVVEVNCIPTTFNEKDLQPVIARVDLNPYVEDIQRAKDLKVLKMKLDDAKKRMEASTIYEMLAEKSPEFKAMLEEYKSRGGQF